MGAPFPGASPPGWNRAPFGRTTARARMTSEHTIRDMRDFRLHVDYVHLNPVKHALASRPSEWPWSSFGRYVEMGWYEPDWCGRADLPGSVEYVCPE